MPLFSGLLLSSTGYTINITITKHQWTDFKWLYKYNITCLESSNKSIDNILMGWLNQGMIMFKLLNFKALLGFWKHGIHYSKHNRLLMACIKIRFFRNKGKHQYIVLFPISNIKLKDWFLDYLLTNALTIFWNKICHSVLQ